MQILIQRLGVEPESAFLISYQVMEMLTVQGCGDRIIAPKGNHPLIPGNL